MKITDKVLFSFPVVVGICGGVWWASAVNTKVENLESIVGEVRSDVKTLLKRSPELDLAAVLPQPAHGAVIKKEN